MHDSRKLNHVKSDLKVSAASIMLKNNEKRTFDKYLQSCIFWFSMEAGNYLHCAKLFN